MSPKTTPVSEEAVLRWVELRRAGWPFARIGKAEGIDRRIVARLVRQHEAKGIKEATAYARQQVAARLLGQHFDELEGAAGSLVRIVMPPSLRGRLHLEAPAVEDSLRQSLAAGQLTRQVYPPGAGPDPLDRHRARRQAEALVAALGEHLPGLWEGIEEWRRPAEEYHRVWQEVEGLAQSAGFSAVEARSGVEEALRKRTGDAIPPAVPPAGELPPGTAPGRLGPWLATSSRAQEGVERLAILLGELERAFLRLEEMLDPAPLRRALLNSRCRLCPA